MISISNFDELNKILRKQLILQSELPSKRVANSDTLYGVTLDKLLKDKIFISLDSKDNILLFELISRNSSNDINFSETDSNINSYKSYELKIIIYGNTSPDIATNVEARFRTEYVLNDLQNQGIYIESVSEPIIIREFINESQWTRTDLSIYISCKFEIKPITMLDDYSDYSDIIVIKGE